MDAYLRRNSLSRIPGAFDGPDHKRSEGIVDVQSWVRLFAVLTQDLRNGQNMRIGLPRECFAIISGSL